MDTDTDTLPIKRWTQPIDDAPEHHRPEHGCKAWLCGCNPWWHETQATSGDALCTALVAWSTAGREGVAALLGPSGAAEVAPTVKRAAAILRNRPRVAAKVANLTKRHAAA